MSSAKSGETIGCAMGPCVKSKARGGDGCDLCDRVAHLPQRDHYTAKAATITDEGFVLK